MIDVTVPSTAPDPRRAGDARTEGQRRARVVKGWAFRNLSDERKQEIVAYLDGGPVPSDYGNAHTSVR